MEETIAPQHAKNYLNLIREHGEFCSGSRYVNEYIINTHDSKSIHATVVTSSIHPGSRTVTTTKQYVIRPGGKINKVKLGCTGFDAGSMSHDTKHERRITEAYFV